MPKTRSLLRLSMFIDDNEKNIRKINKQKHKRREDRIRKVIRNIRFFDIDLYSEEFNEIFENLSQ